MKTPYQPTKNSKFDLKILLAGGAGSGKTHFAGTYTLGPVHFYMLDKGGEITLNKLLKGRPKDCPITVDQLSSNDLSLSDVWSHIQQDEKDGFFDYMAEHNGLIVLDSLTNIAIKGTTEIASKCSITPPAIGKKADGKKKFSFVHWDQIASWLRTIIGTMQDLPCATITTVHIMTMTDGDGAVVGKKPLIQGSMRDKLDIDFTEVYLCEAKKNKNIIHMKSKGKFDAKTKAFEATKLENVTLDMLAKAYVSGDTLKKYK